jgi:hypothetical protein
LTRSARLHVYKFYFCLHKRLTLRHQFCCTAQFLLYDIIFKIIIIHLPSSFCVSARRRFISKMLKSSRYENLNDKETYHDKYYSSTSHRLQRNNKTNNLGNKHGWVAIQIYECISSIWNFRFKMQYTLSSYFQCSLKALFFIDFSNFSFYL